MIQQLRFKCVVEDTSISMGHAAEQHRNPMKWGGLDPNSLRILLSMRKTRKTRVFNALKYISLTHTCFLASCFCPFSVTMYL